MQNSLEKSEVDIETRIILSGVEKSRQILDKIYPKIKDWDRILKKASLNRVLYIFAKNLMDYKAISKSPLSPLTKKLELIIDESKKRLIQLKKTLTFLKEISQQYSIPFLVIKTHRTLPFITLDVDILVKPNDFNNFKKLIKLPGYKEKSNNPNIQPHIKLPDMLTIDLHRDISWGYCPYIDQDLVWEKPQKVKIEGIECLIPSIEVETIIMIIHTFRERFQLTLLEFLFLKHNHKRINWSLIVEQSRKYGWQKSLIQFILITNTINEKLYPQEKELLVKLEETQGTPSKYKFKSCLSMPHIYSLPFILSIFFRWTIKNRRPFSIYLLLYYFYALIRYKVTKGLMVPMYRHWFSFEKLKNIR